MPRVIGVEIPDNKRLVVALTYIYGVGRTTSEKLCKDLNLDVSMRARTLNEDQIQLIGSHPRPSANTQEMAMSRGRPRLSIAIRADSSAAAGSSAQKGSS